MSWSLLFFFCSLPLPQVALPRVTYPRRPWCGGSVSRPPEMTPCIARWRAGVGPPVVRDALRPWTGPADELTVVSWNTALGAADIPRFVGTLPRSRPLVLLLQEVYRGGDEVPRTLPPGAGFARRQGGSAAGPPPRAD